VAAQFSQWLRNSPSGCAILPAAAQFSQLDAHPEIIVVARVFLGPGSDDTKLSDFFGLI
jgi:hypothetical protein